VLKLFRFTLTQLLLPKDTKSYEPTTSTDEPCSGQSLTAMQVVILLIVLVGELIHPFWVGSNCMTAEDTLAKCRGTHGRTLQFSGVVDVR
jgi:hypothetical protein